MKKVKEQSILIVDDVAENIKLLINLLAPDYEMYFAKNGKTAVEIAENKIPDLILLDIMMPEMDGYEVCAILKSNLVTKDIPIIFISAMNEIGDETKGLEIGAVDYIIKPISPPILKARVRNHLKLRAAMLELKRLYGAALDANPRTGLPGNNSVEKRIQEAINNKENACIIYTDLDNFKAYNDKYGFACGDDVIIFTAQVLESAVRLCCVESAFIGHIGGDDFVLVVPLQNALEVSECIAQRFDDGIVKYYNDSDKANGYIRSVDRQGNQQIFPLISISMAGVDLYKGEYSQYIQVNDACAEAKKKAKSKPGSVFFMDRRKTPI